MTSMYVWICVAASVVWFVGGFFAPSGLREMWHFLAIISGFNAGLWTATYDDEKRSHQNGWK